MNATERFFSTNQGHTSRINGGVATLLSDKLLPPWRDDEDIVIACENSYDWKII